VSAKGRRPDSLDANPLIDLAAKLARIVQGEPISGTDLKALEAFRAAAGSWHRRPWQAGDGT
jgi:hypothetical protein